MLPIRNIIDRWLSCLHITPFLENCIVNAVFVGLVNFAKTTPTVKESVIIPEVLKNYKFEI